ncbi:MAG: winged helix-turn-helix transcriptional regulator [Verrucomicrobiaceae bacterium]|nr:winged helix-turn-helix transcriptional regulator [Verrucomicrobiaceae bacterium]
MSSLILFARALADPTRCRIIRLVIDEALCVCELADILEMPQSSVSSHVQIIRKAGMLDSEKCEKWTYFRIEPAYRRLLRNMEKFFDPLGKETENEDAKKAAARLKQREGSCCPGPKRLASRRHSRKHASISQ